MNWTHRLVLFPDSGVIKVMEVYYDAKGLPWGCNNAAAIHTEDDADSPHESILGQLLDMARATREPVLNIATDFIGEAPKCQGER